MRTWADVAVLAKTKSLKGRFVARAAAGLPFLLEEGDEVRFVPPLLDVPREGTVSYVRLIDDHSAEVAFEGIEGEAAMELAGRHCLIRRSAIDESVFEQPSGAWEGWTVVDEAAGDLGVVCGIIDNPAQTLIEVARPDGSQVLVPAVDEIVREVDVDAKSVHVKLPTGLLDL